MKKICRRLLSVLILTTLIMSFCMSVSAEDFSVTVEKAGEIPNKFDVFNGGENRAFNYYYLGAGFGIREKGRRVRIVDVNGENHVDKIYDGVQMIYHGRYQLGSEKVGNNDEKYDLILEGKTVCRSNIMEKKALHDDLFVFEADGDYVIFDLEDAKELAAVPVSDGTDAGIFDDDYWILRDGKHTFFDDDNKEVYTTGNKIIRDWDGKINTYNNRYFAEKTDDNKYHIHDTDYKEILTLDFAPDRILHDGQFYVEGEVLYDKQGKSIAELPNNDRVYELEDSFLVQDLTEEKRNGDYHTFCLYDYSGKILKTFESKGVVEEKYGCGYYTLKGKDPAKDKDLLFCPDGKILEGFYDDGSLFWSSDPNEEAADLYVINDRDFTLKDMNGPCANSNYELIGSSDLEILAKKDSDKGKKTVAIYNVLDGKLLLDEDIRDIPGCVGDYFFAESASDPSKWIVYRMNIDDE